MHNLKIVIVVLNNRRLGIVSQFQLMNWETDCTFLNGKENPNFAEIARAYGLNCSRVEGIEDLKRINIKVLKEKIATSCGVLN